MYINNFWALKGNENVIDFEKSGIMIFRGVSLFDVILITANEMYQS